MLSVDLLDLDQITKLLTERQRHCVCARALGYTVAETSLELGMTNRQVRYALQQADTAFATSFRLDRGR